MLKRGIMIFACMALGLSLLSGCYEAGKATGKAVEDVKQGADDFKRGYKDGKE